MATQTEQPQTVDLEALEQKIQQEEAAFRSKLADLKAQKKALGIKTKRYTSAQRAKDTVRDYGSILVEAAQNVYGESRNVERVVLDVSVTPDEIAVNRVMVKAPNPNAKPRVLSDEHKAKMQAARATKGKKGS